jgi:hypothetical protein
MPTFESDLGPNGQLQSQYTLNAQAPVQSTDWMSQEDSSLGGLPQLNTQPLQQLQSYANSGSNNPWVQAQMQAEQQAQGQAMGSAEQNANAAGAGAASQMAAQGGINTGAQQNLARNTANNSTMAGQGVIGTGLQQQGAIQTQNAQNELGVLSNLPGQEVQAMQPALQEQSLWQQAATQNQNADQQLAENQQQYQTGVNQYNIGNTLGGLNAQNQFNLTDYQNQVAQQAGSEEAQAQANSGKK